MVSWEGIATEQPSHGEIVIVRDVPLSLARHYDTAAAIDRHSCGPI